MIREVMNALKSVQRETAVKMESGMVLASSRT